MQYSDKTKEKCPDLTYSWCVDLGWSRLAVNELIVGEFTVEDFARYSFALYVVTVLTAGTPGVAEVVAALRTKAQLLSVLFLEVAPETTVLSTLLRLLRLTRVCGHFSSF
jgi:hypothetical protein